VDFFVFTSSEKFVKTSPDAYTALIPIMQVPPHQFRAADFRQFEVPAAESADGGLEDEQNRELKNDSRSREHQVQQ
ncbi:unnamed protein product, partial [Bubo scandiacus]